jgi:hypothetical protein
MLIRKAQTSKKVQLNVDSVSHWMATNNARDNLKKRDYFERFGIADGLRHLAEDHPFRPRTLAVSTRHHQPQRSHRMKPSKRHRQLSWHFHIHRCRRAGLGPHVQYHSQDIVPIRAKVKYTTLIEVPPTEKIMEAATGDKDFWIVDVVGNFCFVHPAKQGISSNLNLITDKGNIYSFTLQDISASSAAPDLKVIIEPADRSSIVAASGPPQFVPPPNWKQSKQQLPLSSRTLPRRWMNTRAPIQRQLKFDYVYKRTKRPSIFSRSITTTSSPTSRRMRRRSSACTR